MQTVLSVCHRLQFTDLRFQFRYPRLQCGYFGRQRGGVVCVRLFKCRLFGLILRAQGSKRFGVRRIRGGKFRHAGIVGGGKGGQSRGIGLRRML